MLSSVLPLKWKVKDGESSLSCDMKDKIRTDFTARYENRLLDNVLDPRFSELVSSVFLPRRKR